MHSKRCFRPMTRVHSPPGSKPIIFAKRVRGSSMFRLLKLTPPHGWNAVGWELAIVTLGVLFALAAQQIVETLHDRSTARQTRAEVVDELNSDLMSIQLRASIEPCIE